MKRNTGPSSAQTPWYRKGALSHCTNHISLGSWLSFCQPSVNKGDFPFSEGSQFDKRPPNLLFSWEIPLFLFFIVLIQAENWNLGPFLLSPTLKQLLIWILFICGTRKYPWGEDCQFPPNMTWAFRLGFPWGLNMKIRFPTLFVGKLGTCFATYL